MNEDKLTFLEEDELEVYRMGRTPVNDIFSGANVGRQVVILTNKRVYQFGDQLIKKETQEEVKTMKGFQITDIKDISSIKYQKRRHFLFLVFGAFFVFVSTLSFILSKIIAGFPGFPIGLILMFISILSIAGYVFWVDKLLLLRSPADTFIIQTMHFTDSELLDFMKHFSKTKSKHGHIV